MKLNRTILIVVIGSVVLNLQSGCQEAEKNPRLQQKITATPSETAKVVQDTKPQEKKIERASIQVEAQKPQQPGVKKAVIKVTEKTHDFGKVAPNKKYDCEFKFTNVGDATLKITRIQSTCGCTVPQLEKKSYEQGETGTIKVTFRTPTRQGNTTKRLYILSNDKENPKLGLTLKATVELKVDFEPKSLDLSLKAENADAKPITIKSKDGKPFAIKSITTTRDVISADFDSTVEDTEFVIVPKVNMDELKNNLRGSVRINVTHPEAGNINIPYSAKALFDISRPRIVIQNADPEKPVLKTVWITSNYGDKIEIESVSSQKGHIELLSREYEENGVKCEVRITPPQQTNESKRYFRDELKIKIKDSKDDLSIFCNGWYPREPAEGK